MKESYVISNQNLDYLQSNINNPIWTDDLNKAARYDEKPHIQLFNLNAKKEVANITTVYTENVTRSSIYQ